MAIALATRVGPRGEALHAPIGDDEAVLMSVDSGRYFGLNAVAMYVWELLVERPMTVAELSQRVCEAFEVDLPTCEADVLKFVNSLFDNGVLQEVAA